MQYLNILKTVEIFKCVEDKDIKAMLTCIGAEVKNIRKGEIILHAGDKPRYVGIVLTGQVYILREDYEGNRSLMSSVTTGEIFAEALCCAGITESPVTVVANTDSTIMQLSFSHILHTCSNSCIFHTKLIENMLKLIANKNLQMQNRMEIVGIKSVRAKVLKYLESFVPRQGKNITIPFNREELADFLCVERSALSHELSRMKNDGLIEYKKNNFILKT